MRITLSRMKKLYNQTMDEPNEMAPGSGATPPTTRTTPPIERDSPWPPIAFLCLIAAVPTGILIFGVVITLLRVQNAARSIPAILGVGAISAAAIYIVFERVSRYRWSLKRGQECLDCGYDMCVEPVGTCPECGRMNATSGEYEPLIARWLKNRRS
jgi:hypothetical protein